MRHLGIVCCWCTSLSQLLQPYLHILNQTTWNFCSNKTGFTLQRASLTERWSTKCFFMYSRCPAQQTGSINCIPEKIKFPCNSEFQNWICMALKNQQVFLLHHKSSQQSHNESLTSLHTFMKCGMGMCVLYNRKICAQPGISQASGLYLMASQDDGSLKREQESSQFETFGFWNPHLEPDDWLVKGETWQLDRTFKTKMNLAQLCRQL